MKDLGSHISCKECVQRWRVIVVRTFNMARPEMGHIMVFTPTGRAALCNIRPEEIGQPDEVFRA